MTRNEQSWRTASLTTVSLLLVCVGLGRGAVAGPATSQPASQPASHPTSQAASRPAGDAASQPTKPVPKLSPVDQMIAAQRYLKEMRTILLEIVNLAKQARRNKNIVKANCISQYAKMILATINRATEDNDKLSAAIKALKTEKKIKQKEKIPANPKAEAMREVDAIFARVFGHRGRVDRLAAEARACTGTIDVLVVPTLQMPDPTKPIDHGPDPRPLIPPPLASPARP